MATATEVTEQVKAADDNLPMLWHRFCTTCNPRPGLGTAALCGEKLLGVPAPDDVVEPVCEMCDHFLRMHFILRVPFPCGH